MGGVNTVLPNKFQCLCEPNKANIKLHLNNNHQAVGAMCTVCNMDFQQQEHCVQEQKDSFENNEVRLGLNLNEIETRQNHQESRTVIDLEHFTGEIKAGDHITWQRKLGYWNHAIVEDVDVKQKELGLIQWNKEDGRIKIIRDCLNIETQKNRFNSKMYRIDYSKETSQSNNADLVLARAKSALEDIGYGPVTNCSKSFVFYCKTGVQTSDQNDLLKGKVRESISCTIIKTARSSVKKECPVVQRTASVSKRKIPSSIQEVTQPSGGKENLSDKLINLAVKVGEFVKDAIVLVIDGESVTWNLSTIYEQRRNGTISRKEFIEMFVQQIIYNLATVGIGVCSVVDGLIAIGTPLTPLGKIVSFAEGKMLKALQSFGEKIAGKAISSLIETDDRAVANIKELQYGDHIVLPRWILHPRCHAIFVEHDEINKIKVVRNKHSVGVVEEWIPFPSPLYRFEYTPGTCNDPRDVVEIARSKLGEKRYNIFTYSCKTFARQCKLIPTD